MARYVGLLACFWALCASAGHADDLAFIPKVDTETLRAARVQQIHDSYRNAYVRAAKLQAGVGVAMDEFCVDTEREIACYLSFRALRDKTSRLVAKTELLFIEVEMVRIGASGVGFEQLRASVEEAQLELDADFAYLITHYKEIAPVNP